MEQDKLRPAVNFFNSENEQNSSNGSYQTEGANNGSVPAVPYSSGAYPQGNPAAAGTGYGMPANNQQYTYGVPYNTYWNLPDTMPNQYGNNGAEWQNGMAGR